MERPEPSRVNGLVQEAEPRESSEDQIAFLLELSKSLLQDNALEALNYAMSAKEKAEAAGKKRLLPQILMSIGNAYKFVGEFPKAILTLQRSIDLAKENGQQQEQAAALKNLGIVYKNVGEYSRALDCYLRCSKINDESGQAERNGAILSNIGNLYRMLKNYDKSINYHKQALDLYTPKEPKSVKAGRLINLGVSYYEKNDFRQALSYYQQALDLTEFEGPELYSALSMANIGLINLKSGQHEEALTVLNRALKIFEDMQNHTGMQNALLDLSQVYKHTGRYDKAIRYIDRSLEIAERLQTKESLKNCYKEYYEVYEHKGDFKRALEYHKLYTEVKDSIIAQTKTRQIAELETKAALEKLEMKNEMIRGRNEELKGINEELEQFAYAASHDLKEPLRMIKSYTTLLEKREAEKLDGDSVQFMHFITDGVDRMEKLLTDLLHYSRIGREKLEWETVELGQILEGVLQNLSATIEERQVRIKASPLPKVRAHSSQMTQLFQNLISNGIKFNTGDEPSIDIGCREEGEEYIISIKDNGIGIDEQYKDRVFQIFKRLNRRDEFEGTGIGLSTCKKICERHGGRIWFDSEPGRGTSFYFSLPRG